MSSMDLTRDWLNTVARPYAARERLVTEVIEVLTARRTLAVKTDAFTFDSGQTYLLVLLHGTLPITFRGATYHIPVNVWIPHDYPRSPPLAYVVPTRDMGVRKGNEVEPGGRVKEEVVATWWASWQSKTIEVLLSQLMTVFSAVPPVYAKPAAASAVQASVSPGPSRAAQPPPPPARPTESLPQYHPPAHAQGSTPVPGHVRQSSIPQAYVSPPQSPMAGGGQPPIPARPAQGPPLRQGSLPPSSPIRDGQPPVPHRPYVQVPDHMQSGPGSPHSASGPALPQRPQSIHTQHAPNGQPYPNQAFHPQYATNGGYHASPPSIPQQPMSIQQSQHPPTAAHPPQSPSSRPIQARPPQPIVARPMDLMSGVDDDGQALGTAGSPPPLPPSKPPPPSTLHLHSILLPHLQASLPPLLHQLHSTRTHLTERKDDLESGEPAIKDEMARLQAVKKVCDSTGRKMEDVIQAGSARVADLEQRGETSVDEVVCGISIVHNQLIDLVAEDNAIEDTIYHITRALDAERIDLDRFLKSIRSLAREQYMKRALIERIQQGMGQPHW